MFPLTGLTGVAGIGIEWHLKVELVKRPTEDMAFCLQLHELKNQNHRERGETDLPAVKGKQKAA